MAEPIALLLLPAMLEIYELADHARELLGIPRVIALEPARFRTPRLLRNSAPARAAKHLRLPGEPRVVILYHPAQYRLARALMARYPEAELWYVRPNPVQFQADSGRDASDLAELDNLAVDRAERLVSRDLAAVQQGSPVRQRLLELGIISSRPFVPGARIGEATR